MGIPALASQEEALDSYVCEFPLLFLPLRPWFWPTKDDELVLDSPIFATARGLRASRNLFHMHCSRTELPNYMARLCHALRFGKVILEETVRQAELVQYFEPCIISEIVPSR
jgi:hypothetical protein